jgi:hypothetical protein
MQEAREKARKEREEHRNRLFANVKDRFAELGQFVQAFELMVAEARYSCLEMLKQTGAEIPYVRIALHHQGITAKTIIDIWRALYGQLLRDKRLPVPDNDIASVNEVLAQIQVDYEKAISRRNIVVHGTWNIGIAGWEDEFTLLQFQKLNVTAKGLDPHASPKDVAELNQWTEDCSDIEYAIAIFGFEMLFENPVVLSRAFTKTEKRWHPVQKRVPGA